MTETDDPLTRLMAGMAGGDTAFFFAFVEEFGPKVAWVVRDILRAMGRHDLVHDDAEIDGLTLDACEVIFDRASGWKPGGAAPWTWAHKAIRSRVAATIGHRTIELDSEEFDGEAGSHHSVVVVDLTGDDLDALISRHPRVGLLDAAICSVGTERNQQIYWEYRIQQGLGDPSPAITVAAQFDVQPDNVRQICRRHDRKVWELIHTDERFAPLRDHGWFAA